METRTTPESVAIVALGKNWQKSKLPPQPIEGTTVFASMDTYQTAVAAGLLYLKRKQTFGESIQDTIVFSTGHTLGELDEQGENLYPTEAAMMELQFRQVFSPDEIPDEALVKEERSIDTAGNAEEAGKDVRHRDIREAIVVTVARHASRAETLFRNYNPDIRTRTAVTEKILEGNGYEVEELPVVEKAKEAVLEAGMRALLLLDPYGRIPRLVTEKIRM